MTAVLLLAAATAVFAAGTVWANLMDGAGFGGLVRCGMVVLGTTAATVALLWLASLAAGW